LLSAPGTAPKEAMTRSTLLQECASSAMTAMKRTGVHRFLVVSSAMLFPGGGPLPTFSPLPAPASRARPESDGGQDQGGRGRVDDSRGLPGSFQQPTKTIARSRAPATGGDSFSAP